jgi:hypothetical protein
MRLAGHEREGEEREEERRGRRGGHHFGRLAI